MKKRNIVFVNNKKMIKDLLRDLADRDIEN
jgi:hypothetical protein